MELAPIDVEFREGTVGDASPAPPAERGERRPPPSPSPPPPSPTLDVPAWLLEEKLRMGNASLPSAHGRRRRLMLHEQPGGKREGFAVYKGYLNRCPRFEYR